MWRKCITLALIFTVVMYGQTSLAQEATASAPVRDWRTAKESRIPIVLAVPRYNKLRRGREELIAVQVRMGLPEDLNNGYDLSFHGGSLWLSAPEGFTIRYKNGKPIQTASPIPM